MTKAAEFFDGETAKVFLAASGSTFVSLANFNIFLNTVVLIGTAVYIWRKVLRKRKP